MRNLLIAGGGHASLPIIKMGRHWKRKGLYVTLVSPHPFLIYSGTLPQYIAGFYNWEQTAVNLKRLCGRYGVRFIQAEIESVCNDEKTVTMSTGDTLSYDLLVINTGAVTRTAGIISQTGTTPAASEESENIYPVKPFSQLLALRDKVRSGAVKRLLIAGGGAAGTELALNFSHPDNPFLPPGTEIHLIEHGSRILSSFSREATRVANSILSKRAVSIHIHTGYHHTMAGAYDAVILATGNEPVSSRITHGLKTGAGKRILTAGSLIAVRENSVFAAGDTADAGGRNLAQIGVHAVKQGVLLRNNIDSLIRGKTLSEYHPYPVNPLIISNGPDHAIIITNRLCLSGRGPAVLKYMLDTKWLQKYNHLPEERDSWYQLLKKGWLRSGNHQNENGSIS
jgi:NADH dehydrogenase FAD-containing subunit